MCLVAKERNGFYRWHGWSWTTSLEIGSLIHINRHLGGRLLDNGVFKFWCIHLYQYSYVSLTAVSLQSHTSSDFPF